MSSNESGNRNIHMGSGDYRETYIKDQGTYIENQYNTAEQKTLAEAAKEIQQLLDQLSQTYPTNTSTEKMVIATEVIKEVEKNQVINYLKILQLNKCFTVLILLDDY